MDATGLLFSRQPYLDSILALTTESDPDSREIVNIVQTLITEMHASSDANAEMHAEMDRYWFAMMLIAIKSPLLKKMGWRRFVLSRTHVFGIQDVMDIGPYVRKLSMNRAISSDIMCRIIQYSLPYVKHNRLNFPRYKDMSMHVLVGLVHMVLVLLLGLCFPSSKKPVWHIRFSVLTYIQTLLSNGSQYDLYLFCMHNVNIVRIAVIEYFVYFVQNNMPCEYDTLNLMFGTHCNVYVVFRQFCTNIDTFRVHALQVDKLCWSELNAKAHNVIEKCNRLCKSKPRINVSKPSTFDKSNFELSLKLLHYPRFKHVFYYKMMHPSITMSDVSRMTFLHENIKPIALPAAIQQLQCRHVLAAMDRDTKMYQHCLNVYVCFRCLPSEQCINTNMRIDVHGQIFCNTCHQKDALFCINIFGRLLRIFRHIYYLCHHCLSVHEWHGVGSEFFLCPVKRVVCKSRRLLCQICTRNIGVTTHSVLDTNIGVMQTVALCQRHGPREHEHVWNHNLDACLECVKRRLAFRGYRT